MKRTVEVATRGTRLYVEAGRLVLEREKQILARVPLADLGLLVLDSTGIRVSSGLLAGIAQAGAAVLVCDDKHLPKGMFLPYLDNTLHAERIRQQASASRPLEKNLWSLVVQAKIRNQAVLIAGTPAENRLRRLVLGVRSGDSSNHEAQAAQAYWPIVFKDLLTKECSPFRRRPQGDSPNPLLNYGYAVLRAATARALVGAGLHTGLGIHHHNRYSGHPLADDIMEPFRPWVDAKVRQLLAQGCSDLDKDSKRVLLECLTDPVAANGAASPLLVALGQTASSLAGAFDRSTRGAKAPEAAKQLILPCWPARAGAA